MNRRLRVLLPLLILLLGGIAATVIARSKPQVERVESAVPPPLVRTATAEPLAARLDVSSQGTVAPRTETVLIAQVAGRIEWVSPAFADGGFFSRGQTLLRLEASDYELAVAQAEAAVAQAASRLELETAEAEVARQEWEELGSGEANALVLRQPQLAEARANVEAAKASLSKARLDLERTRISAPFTGRLRSKQADLGQFVAPGTPLASAFGTDYAEIRLPVSQQELGFLDLPLGEPSGEAGPEVTLRGQFGGQIATWPARVVRTAGSVDQRSRMLDLIARVDDPFRRRPGASGPPLPMGLFVDAEIAGREVEEVFVLPRGALREGQQVLVLDQDQRLRFRTVEVLRTKGEEVFVSGGLEAGEEICVSPIVAVVDGMEVRTDSTSGEPS
ncbi:MAG: efflux RND transporter periplasmic adaptor subunit [Acidobacteriota bacterium]